MAVLAFKAPTTPRASKSTMGIVADTRELAQLARTLRRVSPEAWQAYRRAVRVAAEIVLRDAKSRTDYSKRIPESMKIVIMASGNVKIVAGGENAPDASPIENKGKGFVRHPTYGHRDRWTDLHSHPAFLAPALAAHREEVLNIIENAVSEAVAQAIALKGL